MKIISLVLAGCFAFANIHAAQPQLIMSGSRPSVSASGHSSAPLLSGDGRRVAYLSAAPNLVSNQNSGGFNLFFKDLNLGTSTLLSRATNASGFHATTLLLGVSYANIVAYQSDAAEVSTANSATNFTPQIFVRDVLANNTQLVTETITGNLAAYPGRNSIMSSDGRYIVFQSTALDLVPLDPAQMATTNVYRRDLLLRTNILISRDYQSAWFLGDRDSSVGGVSADGQRVAFISKATDVVVNSLQRNLYGDVYVFWNPNHAEPIWCGSLSNYFISATNPAGSYRCLTAPISADGKFVAISAASTVDGTTMLFWRDVDGYITSLVASNVPASLTPQISTNGAFITFEDGTNVLRWSNADGLVQVVSVTTNGVSLSSHIARESRATPDGNTIVFLSDSPELTSEGSTNLQVYVRNMTTGITRLVSIATNGAAGKGVSAFTTVSVSDDGSRLAFDSDANDLVPMDNNDASDVFVRDLTTQQTILVSAALPGSSRVSGTGHAYVGANAFSADARFITFTSFDNDLINGDTNARPDVFITDLASNVTFAIGISNGMSTMLPSISGDGRAAVYAQLSGTSERTDTKRLFRFDRITGTNQLVWQGAITSSPTSSPAINMDGSLVAHCEGGILTIFHTEGGTNEFITNAQPRLRVRGEMQDAVFTPDSRFVLFSSTSVLTPHSNTDTPIYAWDRVTRTIQLVTLYFGSGYGFSSSISVSTNSRYVAWCGKFSPTQLHRFDLLTGMQWTLDDPSDYSNPSLSGDGGLIACQNRTDKIRLINCQNGEAITVASNGVWSSPLISPDARFITVLNAMFPFAGQVARDLNQLAVYDRLSGTMTRAFNANANISRATASADGRTIAFHTVASDLAPGDFNDRRDIFVLRLGVDSDHDGLDDDWEVTYLNNLSRDGSGDFDNDGASDRDEFLAGTDPKNEGSYFRVLTLTPLGGNNTRVIWNGNPARNYRVEFKDDVNAAAWNSLNAPITWNGNTATITDPTATNAHRFYRAVRLP